MSFEYLFDKIDHNKAQNKSFSLKMELSSMFTEYPELLNNTSWNPDSASEKIKEIRRKISHRYEYYYDFENDRDIQILMLLLDKLIKCMSLRWSGFTKDEIIDYSSSVLSF